MDFKGFLNAICDDGITAAHESYKRPDQAEKLDGSVLGFEDARAALDLQDLAAIMASAAQDTLDARNRQDPRYWFWRCRELEVQWTANVLSAALHAQGLPGGIITPTARGVLKAADILGVAR